MIFVSACKPCLAFKTRRGFSLAEFSIVLAMLGMVLGALWSLVSVIRENIAREQSQEQAMQIVHGVRDFYLGRACASTDTNCGRVNEDLTAFLFQQSVLLPEMIRRGTWLADHAWGPEAAAGGAMLSGGFGVMGGDGGGVDPRQFFSLEWRGLKRSSCIVLASKISGAGGPKGIDSVWINGVNVGNIPVPPETADAQCVAPVGLSNTIRFVYRLRPTAT